MVPSIETSDFAERHGADERPAPTRIIAVELTEEEWRAFRAVEPQPLVWLQRQIRDRVGAAGAAYDDEY